MLLVFPTQYDVDHNFVMLKHYLSSPTFFRALP
jgi:hypothetical protein